MDFSDYDLRVIKDDPRALYELAGDLLPEMAGFFSYNLGTVPLEEALTGFIQAISPRKELQSNIDPVREALGDGAVGIAAEWLERSGLMEAVSGAFWTPADVPIPDKVDAVIWCGGVANWLYRRQRLTLGLSPASVGRIVLPMGIRQMTPSEHESVRAMAEAKGEPPTEYEFAAQAILPDLKLAGFDADVLKVASKDGDEICEGVFRHYPGLLHGTILAIGNAPAAIQVAGQLRVGARKVDRTFDEFGDQLFMMGDAFPVARHGEDKSTHQNPLSGVGAILRNALFLYRAIAD